MRVSFEIATGLIRPVDGGDASSEFIVNVNPRLMDEYHSDTDASLLFTGRSHVPGV